MMRVAVFGAGSIGCYLGARLAASGTAVHLIGRQRIGQAISEHGLSASDHLGGRWQVAPDTLGFAKQADAQLAQQDVLLVCVKSDATQEAAEALQAYLKAGALVISFQNGLHNAARLQQLLPQQTVLAGMVPFNVVNQGQGHFHQGSEGELDVQAHPHLTALAGAFEHAGLPLKQHPDMQAVLWSKLILNLNNAVNALSGLPLKAELSQRSYRRVLAQAQREALALMQQAGITPAKIIALPTRWVPRALDVPDAVFRILGSKMLAIDPQARSSMWEDLEQGRATEIDWLNGEVLRLADKLGQAAPVNQMLVKLIRAAEQGGRRDWSGAELLQQI